MTVEDITSTVGSVFQDPRSQFFTTDTTSEMAFTCENMGVPRDEMLNRIALSSYVLDVSGLLERSIFDLSSGERHHVITLGEFRGHVMMNPPDEKMEKAACALDRAMRFPHALRYREYYRKKTSSKGTRSSWEPTTSKGGFNGKRILSANTSVMKVEDSLSPPHAVQSLPVNRREA